MDKCSICNSTKRVGKQKFQFVNNLIKDGQINGEDRYTYKDPPDDPVSYTRLMCNECVGNIKNKNSLPVVSKPDPDKI